MEYVTIIPKNSCPESPAECRNLSCTNFLSKVFERIVLKKAREQVQPKTNQYGGEKGCSTDHFLVDVWDQITDHLEDQRAATVLTAIDYSKAFNRLEHGAVLRQFKKAGASTQILSLLASFLIGRTMTVKAGQAWSTPRNVNAGAPQGSVLGTYIFNVGTDSLEDGFDFENEPVQYELQENDLLFLETVGTSQREVSTPIRPISRQQPRTPGDITPIRGQQRIELLPRVVNPPQSRRVEPSWRHRKIQVRKYVDDNLQGEKLRIKAGTTYSQGEHLFKNVRATQSEMLFNYIAAAAKDQGLLVNTNKTTLLTISGARSYQAKSHIYDADNNRVDSKPTLKILGFIFNETGTVADQIEALTKKFNMRTWTLRELSKNGFSETECLKVYTTMLRPIIEYSAVVYHSMLSKEQAEQLEKLQVRALKCIYGHVYSAAQLLKISQLPTLAERRQKACLRFAQKTSLNHRFSNWFPKRVKKLRGQHKEEFVEYQARTDRRKNSPLFYYRRILNTDRVEYDVRLI